MTKIVRIFSVPGEHSTQFFSVTTGTGVRSKIRPAHESHLSVDRHPVRQPHPKIVGMGKSLLPSGYMAAWQGG
jgi:hypothetical protein